MTGVSWRPPPRTDWLGQRCAGRSLEGGLLAERLGVRVTVVPRASLGRIYS